MKLKSALCVAACLALVLPSFVAAQTITNPDKGAPSPDFTHNPDFIVPPDDGYDGTIGSMACLTVPGQAGTVEDVNVEITMSHTWVGDLTYKVVSPAGTITTLMSRPGYAELADDGDGCCGPNSDLVTTSPITFDDTAASGVTGELLGDPSGIVVCQDDGICDFIPAPDTGPGVSLADFNGEDGDGDWMVCVGDSALGDTGDFESAAVIITAAAPSVIEVPTVNGIGLFALMALLALGSVVFLRRRSASH